MNMSLAPTMEKVHKPQINFLLVSIRLNLMMLRAYLDACELHNESHG